MRLFGNKKKTKEEKKHAINWISLTNLEQLEEIKNQSKTEIVAIFKHSTRCGISRMVLKQFETSFDEKLKNLKIYYLDLLNYRTLSDEVSYAFQVQHQSPQLLIIKNEIAIAHASHYEVTKIDISKIIDQTSF